MRPFVTKALFSSLLLFLNFLPALVRGGDDRAIRVENIVPRVSNGKLTVSADLENLFSDRIVGTIQSGLPSIIQVEIKLKDARKKTLFRKLIFRKISYDIWEERYRIEVEDSSQVFASFAAVTQQSSRLEHEDLTPPARLRADQQYVIEIRAGIVPISSAQAEKVTDWLLDPNETEEYLASENRASGFELNINKLVSFFVSSRKKSTYTSDWYSSKKFRIRESGRE